MIPLAQDKRLRSQIAGLRGDGSSIGETFIDFNKDEHGNLTAKVSLNIETTPLDVAAAFEEIAKAIKAQYTADAYTKIGYVEYDEGKLYICGGEVEKGEDENE